MGSTPLLFSQKPLLLHNGELTCQAASGNTSEVPLSTHAFLKGPAETPQRRSELLALALQLKR